MDFYGFLDESESEDKEIAVPVTTEYFSLIKYFIQKFFK
jgi:hypothetical protein